MNTLTPENDNEIAAALISRNINGAFIDDILLEVGNYAFNECHALTSIDLPEVTRISGYAFYNCYNLESINSPKATYIGEYAFTYCSKLTSIDFPEVTHIGNNCFNGCSGLSDVNFQNATSIGSNAFAYCTGLVSIDLPKVLQINRNAFRNCSNLTSVILRETESNVVLNEASAFSTANNAIFYVPDELVDTYKTAVNWSTYASRIKGLSELPAA